MENKEIYKVGDVVYYYDPERGCLKGEVFSIREDSILPIYVKFDDFTSSFTERGAWTILRLPTLSFAPYDFVNGGFTQERPVPEIKEDTLVYVRLPYNQDIWHMSFFAWFEDKCMYVFKDQRKSNETGDVLKVWEWSLTNPLEK